MALKKFYVLSVLVLFVAFLAIMGPMFVRETYAEPSASWTGYTTGWAHVRAGPSATSLLLTTYAPNTQVTIYATVTGQIVWDGIASWYRITNFASSPRYIYGGLVAASGSTEGGGTLSGPSPGAQGKVIVVVLSRQWLYAYDNGNLVFNAAVMTGRPSLPTPTGTYHVFAKFSPTTFYSPWPPGSPYWYPPTYINYALEWRAGGYFLHDSWWHSVYGPGTNGWHYDPVDGWQWGSHGCVAMPLSAARWLYNWAPIGTTVQIEP